MDSALVDMFSCESFRLTQLPMYATRLSSDDFFLFSACVDFANF
jgi:hypothetical protein